MRPVGMPYWNQVCIRKIPACRRDAQLYVSTFFYNSLLSKGLGNLARKQQFCEKY
jgi:hypothetical protein